MSGDADLADAGEQHEKDRRDRREFDGGDAVAAALPRVGLDTVRSRYHVRRFAAPLVGPTGPARGFPATRRPCAQWH